jgi:hypothetical protein
MQKIAIFLLGFGVSNFCFGTQQIDDVIFFESQRYQIEELPLDSKFGYDKLQKILNPQLCSASWRGYKAEWFIRDGFLWLSRIIKSPCADEAEHVEEAVLFPDQTYPIKADWYTGEIGLVVGEREYINGSAPKNSTGYKIDTFVFKFKDGLLLSKGLVTKEHIYTKP